VKTTRRATAGGRGGGDPDRRGQSSEGRKAPHLLNRMRDGEEGQPQSLGRGEGEGHPQILRDGPGREETGECQEGKGGEHPLTSRARQTQGRETQEKRRKECGRMTGTLESKTGDGPRQTTKKGARNAKGTPKQTASGDWSESETLARTRIVNSAETRKLAKTRNEETRREDDDWLGW
jgi:hypothetical protein